MRKLLAIAAFLLASTAAQAQYTFDYGGRTIRIDPDRGTVSIPGVYLQESMDMPWGAFWLKGVNFTMGVTHFHNSMDEVIALIRAGRLDPGRIISHRMPLSQADEAYRLFAAREATKIVLDPGS